MRIIGYGPGEASGLDLTRGIGGLGQGSRGTGRLGEGEKEDGGKGSR
jgi:hypothetical protein